MSFQKNPDASVTALWRYELSELKKMGPQRTQCFVSSIQLQLARAKKWVFTRAGSFGQTFLRHNAPKGSGPGMRIKYSSLTARMLAKLVFCPPLNWIGSMQTHVANEQLKQIFGEYDAQPISLALIVRGRPQSRLPRAIP